jgi:thiol-disulfide isomerase/thioredoxin
MDFAAHFAQALTYNDFLAKYGTDEHRRRWSDFHAQVKLSDAQRALLSGFQRQMKVLCMAGAWCGDCVQQCPIFDHFSQATDSIVLRFVDRDASPEVAQELRICGGARVPAVVFLSEDDQEVGRYGDRTLSKYRQVASEQLGAACPTGLVAPPAALVEGVVQDWLNEFERCQLILRTSARLRKLYGD